MKILDVPQSGSLAGQTSSRNRYGQYRRTRAMPTQPRTDAQTSVRAILSGCSAGWAALAAADQLSWKAWSALHPRTDSLGQTVVMTGAQAFNAVNCLLVLVGSVAVSIPPADPLPDPPMIGDPDLDIGTPAFGVAFSPAPVPAATKLVWYCSPPQSLGTTFCGDFRFIGYQSAAGASPFAPYTQIEAKYGTPVLGQRFFFRARTIRTDGGTSPWSNYVFGDTYDGS